MKRLWQWWIFDSIRKRPPVTCNSCRWGCYFIGYPYGPECRHHLSPRFLWNVFNWKPCGLYKVGYVNYTQTFDYTIEVSP